MSRRRLIIIVLAGLIAWAGVVALVGIFRTRDWTRVSTTRTLRSAGVVYLPEQQVFLVANGSHPVALSAILPHSPSFPERVLYCRSSGWFEGVHYGSKFDRFGAYALGPAPRGMDRIAVRVWRGTVYVKPLVVTPGPPRGSPKPQEREGSFCSGAQDPIEDPLDPGFARPSEP